MTLAEFLFAALVGYIIGYIMGTWELFSSTAPKKPDSWNDY